MRGLRIQVGKVYVEGAVSKLKCLHQVFRKGDLMLMCCPAFGTARPGRHGL